MAKLNMVSHSTLPPKEELNPKKRRKNQSPEKSLISETNSKLKNLVSG